MPLTSSPALTAVIGQCAETDGVLDAQKQGMDSLGVRVYNSAS